MKTNIIVLTDKVRQRAEKSHVMTAARSFQSFESINELNRAVLRFLTYNESYFTPAESRVIDVVSRHAVKVPGVCWATVQYITSQADVSPATYFRALNKAEEVGFIRRVDRAKPSGRRGSSLLVIQPFEVGVHADAETIEALDAVIAEVTAAGAEIACAASPDAVPATVAESVVETIVESIQKSPEALPRKGGSGENSTGSIIKHLKAKKIKDLKNDDKRAIASAFANPNFCKSYFYKDVVCGFIDHSHKMNLLPFETINEVSDALIAAYADTFASIDQYNRNDVISSVCAAYNRLSELYRENYAISSFSAFYITLFQKELTRRNHTREMYANRNGDCAAI